VWVVAHEKGYWCVGRKRPHWAIFLFSFIEPWFNETLILVATLYIIVSETTYTVDDKYLTGIWYDSQAGDFCQIARGAPGEYRVQLINPENGNVYHEVSIEDWVERVHQDFRQVSEEAVEDPREVVSRAVRKLSRNDINELSTIPPQAALDLRYARRQVEISEK
jgi:hypothetical protein